MILLGRLSPQKEKASKSMQHLSSDTPQHYNDRSTMRTKIQAVACEKRRISEQFAPNAATYRLCPGPQNDEELTVF